MYLPFRPCATVAIVIAALSKGAFAIKIYSNSSVLPNNIPGDCRDALSADIACFPRLIQPRDILYRGDLNETVLDQYCNCTCTDSLRSWSDNIQEKCGSDSYPWGNDTSNNLTGTSITDPLLWAQKLACLTDKDNGCRFCLPDVANGAVKSCDDCTLQYEAGMLDSKYGDGRLNEDVFTSILSSCGADPSDYPHSTQTPEPVPPYPTSFPVLSCNMGIKHTVKECDTCRSIADAYQVSYDRFLYQNGIDWNCQVLPVGSEVCITECCELHEIEANQTCRDILANQTFSMTELLAWNPILYNDCGNLGALVGRTICISPPGFDYYDVNVEHIWNDTWTLPGNWSSWKTSGIDTPSSAIRAYWHEIPTLTLDGPATVASESVGPTAT